MRPYIVEMRPQTWRKGAGDPRSVEVVRKRRGLGGGATEDTDLSL